MLRAVPGTIAAWFRLKYRLEGCVLLLALTALLATGASFVLLLPGLLAGASLDAAVFTLIGWRIRFGAVPYADLWDHKPPGIYLADAAAQSVLPWLDPWAASWWLSLVAVSATGVVVALTLRRLGLGWEASVAGVAASVGLAQMVISLGGGLTEQLATPFCALSILAVVRRQGARAWVLSGALAACALAISMLAAPLILGIGTFAAVSRPRRLRMLGAWLVGAALVAAAFAAWLWATGALPAALDTLLGYNAAYRAWSDEVLVASLSQASAVVLTLLFLLLPAGLGALAMRRRQEERPLAVALGVWILSTVALFVYEGRFETHYAALLCVPLALLGGFGLVRLRAGHRATAIAMAAPLVVMALLSGVALFGISGDMITSLRAEGARTKLLGDYIAGRTGTDATILVWGSEPQIYYLADRAPASRYIYMYPLTTPGYSDPAQVAAFVSELDRVRPALIVDAGSFEPGSVGDVPLLIPRAVIRNGRSYDALDPARAFIRANYRLLEIVDGWPVYALSDQ